MTISRTGAPRRDMRAEDDRRDALTIWRKLLPTITHEDAPRVRDLAPIVRALRNPRAVELVAARLDERARGSRQGVTWC